MNYKNFFAHWKKVRTHRKWVRKYAFELGIPWQGLVHDLSKYSPTEFFESVKYYQGTRSPIDAAKEDKGYSTAWFHHRGRNKHHHEYWIDNFDKGMTFNIMPYKYFVELVCDYLAAGRAYMGENFSYAKELEWWKSKRGTIAMHPAQIEMLDNIFEFLAHKEEFTHGNDPIFGLKNSALNIRWFISEIYECYTKERKTYVE